MADWIKVVGLGPGEAFEGYCAEPEGSGRPGVVVLQEIFGVTVESVNTANRQGKRKRTRTGYGQRKSTKRAIVTLAADSKPIEIPGLTA